MTESTIFASDYYDKVVSTVEEAVAEVTQREEDGLVVAASHVA